MSIKNYHLELIQYLRTRLKASIFSFIFFISLSTPQKIFSQDNISIKVKNTGLNAVITYLRDNYALNVSFNDDKLSQYKVTLNKTFNNPQEALNYLSKSYPISIELVNNVYVITSSNPNSAAKFLLAGTVTDALSNETLPSSTVFINGTYLVSDQKGNFSYTSNTDSIFRLQVSYLGYLKLDTLVGPNNYLNIKLNQSSIKIAEVVLSSVNNAIESNTFHYTGNLKINHNISENLPGSSDNSVYNILRLQPGVTASGDQSNDLMIWGSYKGQTKVSFDGFTVFGVRNFNDNIGAINPLIAKDLNILKGGYGVSNGDRVGGVVEITGVDGNTLNPNVKVAVNNLTLNGIVSTPVFKNTALTVAARQTYYNLYSPYSRENNSPPRGRVENIVDFTVFPDYSFSDINLKFSGKSDKGDNYFISLFKGGDDLLSEFNTSQGRFLINGTEEERNQQYGSSAFYSKLWKKGSISSFTASSSGLKNTYNQQVKLNFSNNNQNFNNLADLSVNNISESSLKFTHRLPTHQNYSLSMGAGYIYNSTSFTKDSVNVRKLKDENYSSRFYLFSENSYYLSPKLKLIMGLRSDMDLSLRKTYLQPRLAAKYQLNDHLKLSAAWGIYKQFISYNTSIDQQGDLNYTWTVSDGKEIPVYGAQHWVAGLNYEKNNWWFNTDFYYKTIDGITRFIQNNNGRSNIVGTGKAIGVDFLVKKNYKGSTAWVAYTLSKATESYPIQIRNTIFSTNNRAPQDQRHELKFAAIFKINSFYLSSNYVYGSGFPSTNPFDNPAENQLSYNRFDSAITYKFAAKKYRLETGVSVLNVFNTQNLKTGNLERIPTEQASTLNVYSQPVPFTPTIFLNFSL